MLKRFFNKLLAFFMPNACTTTQNCSKQLLQLIGDSWNLSIIMQLQKQELRFCELQRAIEINAVTLSSRLKALENAGFISRHEEVQDKLSVSYHLTSRGQHLLPIIEAIENFAHTH